MSADLSLRVASEVLEEKADQFSGVVRDIRVHFDRIRSISARTRGYWQGDAGTRVRDSYASYQDDISSLLHRLEEHPVDLLAMAGIYRAAEAGAVSRNASLPTDDIV